VGRDRRPKIEGRDRGGDTEQEKEGDKERGEIEKERNR
jgi:hypothetical protein